MPIIHVIRLLKALDDSPNLRHTLNTLSDASAIMEYLNNSGYTFTSGEFEDAVNMLHLRCQSKDEADILMGKIFWLRCLLQI